MCISTHAYTWTHVHGMALATKDEVSSLKPVLRKTLFPRKTVYTIHKKLQTEVSMSENLINLYYNELILIMRSSSCTLAYYKNVSIHKQIITCIYHEHCFLHYLKGSFTLLTHIHLKM